MATRKERSLNREKRQNLTPRGKEILDAYLKALSKLKRYPNKAEIAMLGYGREVLRDHFGSLERLKEYAKKYYPEIVSSVTEEKIRDKNKNSDLSKLIKKYKRFVVTTAINGAPVHKAFLNNLKIYCRNRNALLLILPAGNEVTDMDAELAAEQWVFDKTYLNSNIYVSAIKVPPRSVNPLTSLGRIGQRNGSTIIASPKQFMEAVAVGDSKMPHIMMSTGAVTKAKYQKGDGSYDKTGLIALHDHVLGAIVVEVENDKIYHFTQIQAEKSGTFVERSTHVKDGKIGKLHPSHLVIGDYHVTETDPTAAKAWDEISELCNNPIRVHHDFFSGVSVNHHEEHNQILRAMLMAQNKLSLEQELRACAKVLDEETEKCDLVVIVASNHHDFVSKHYIPRGMYHRDPQNLDFASKLISPMIHGQDPIRYALETLIGLKHPEKVRWLKRDESYKVAEIELGAHGDKGANGSKGSPNTLEKGYGNCVVGHSHTPKIIRGFFQVGTSTYLKLPYTEGTSSWCHTSCLVYPNGARQLINSIGGRWRLKDG
jgi:hypothetical protein